jgi:hypothetical protein
VKREGPRQHCGVLLEWSPALSSAMSLRWLFAAVVDSCRYFQILCYFCLHNDWTDYDQPHNITPGLQCYSDIINNMMFYQLLLYYFIHRTTKLF